MAKTSESNQKKYAVRVGYEKRQIEILEATRILLSEEGYDQLSLRKISAKVGIHLKTLQHYFPTKEQLIHSTLKYTSSLYTQASLQLDESNDPGQQFEEYLCFLLNDDKNKQSAGFFYQLWARAHVDTVTNQTMGEMYRSYTSNIEQFIEPLNPKLNQQVRKQRAIMIGALIEGMMLYIGYGKKRPSGIGDIEREVINECMEIVRRP